MYPPVFYRRIYTRQNRQFDSADTPMYSFRRRFCRSLEKVSDAWPELATSVGEKGLTFLACKPGISMPGLHALFFVDYSRYMVSS